MPLGMLIRHNVVQIETSYKAHAYNCVLKANCILPCNRIKFSCVQNMAKSPKILFSISDKLFNATHRNVFLLDIHTKLLSTYCPSQTTIKLQSRVTIHCDFNLSDFQLFFSLSPHSMPLSAHVVQRCYPTWEEIFRGNTKRTCKNVTRMVHIINIVSNTHVQGKSALLH